MAEIGSIWVKIGAKVDDLQRGLDKATKSVDETRRVAQRAESAFGGLWQQFAVGNLVANATTRILNTFTQVLSNAVKNAIEAERVDKSLAAAIETTGRGTADAADRFKQYASALQQKTVYDDESIKSTQALLIQMTRLSNEGIDRATRGSIGLASVLGIDLKSAALLVAKAMEGNFAALSRYGLKVTETLSLEEKRNELLAQLDQFYQRAEADTKSFGGQVEQLRNAYNDLLETIGSFVIKNEDVIATLSGVKEIIIWLDRNVQSIQKVGGKGFRLVDLTAIGGLQRAFNALGREAKKSNDDFRAWANLMAEIVSAAENATTGPLPALTATYGELDKAVKNATATLNLWKETLKSLEAEREANIAALVPENIGDIIEVDPGDVADAIFPPEVAVEIPETLRSLMGEVGGIVKDGTEQMSDYFAGFYNDIANGFANVFMNFKLTAQGFADFFVGLWDQIKRAFFKVIGEMIAKWLVFKAITGLGSLIGGPIGKAMTAAIAPLKFWASGFQGLVTQPTLAVVGESGPEYVSVTPAGGGATAGGSGVTLNLYAPMISTTGISRNDAREAADVLFDAIQLAARKRGYAIG